MSACGVCYPDTRGSLVLSLPRHPDMGGGLAWVNAPCICAGESGLRRRLRSWALNPEIQRAHRAAIDRDGQISDRLWVLSAARYNHQMAMADAFFGTNAPERIYYVDATGRALGLEDIEAIVDHHRHDLRAQLEPAL